ncbi:hypothetical protein [Luteimonas sp. MHLX1A]|uniref:hypothetical protein n=1 Tax=Alterluteimonas muca TaxID=2878684 RepID=UPI001E31FBAE|nr:hypothetical protein [Luteimonas sp. MHLX1A]MCD9045612.1 hypothetical protein [Luteimonas sp. MHLX1A]
MLEDAAQRGDAEASFRIGQALAYCLRYRPVPAAQLTQMLASAIAEVGDAVRIGGRPVGDDRNIDLFLYAHAEGERLCAGTDSLRETPPAGTAYGHIARAAAQGHPGAMALYPQVAFEEFQDPAALVDNATKVARRRDLARTMLEAAIRAGEPDALRNAAGAYASDGWLPADPPRALAYWFAYLGTPDGQRLPEGLRMEMETKFLHGQPADTVGEARAVHGNSLQRMTGAWGTADDTYARTSPHHRGSPAGRLSARRSPAGPAGGGGGTARCPGRQRRTRLPAQGAGPGADAGAGQPVISRH